MGWWNYIYESIFCLHRRKTTYVSHESIQMTPEQHKAFDRAFEKLGEAFSAMDAAFKKDKP